MAIPSAFSPGSGDLKFTSYNDFTSSFILFHRYTLWIPLYPLGFICEGVIALRNIPYFEETDKYTLNTITDLQSASFILLLSIFCLKVFDPSPQQVEHQLLLPQRNPVLPLVWLLPNALHSNVAHVPAQVLLKCLSCAAFMMLVWCISSISFIQVQEAWY